MKQAMGEANMTIVIVLIIAVLSVLFFSFIWPNIKMQFKHDTRCDDAICLCPEFDANGKCSYHGATVECYFKEDRNKKITCAWKG